MHTSDIDRAADILNRGGIVAHATEGVWGFACDPWSESAVHRILQAKQRSMGQGLIVIGADSSYFELELRNLMPEVRKTVEASWPGHVTWVVPTARFPDWITGNRESVAVRVPNHDQARQISRGFGKPVVSTSVNVSGDESATTYDQVRKNWGTVVDFVVPGSIGSSIGPSEIHNATTRAVIR